MQEHCTIPNPKHQVAQARKAPVPNRMNQTTPLGMCTSRPYQRIRSSTIPTIMISSRNGNEKIDESQEEQDTSDHRPQTDYDERQ